MHIPYQEFYFMRHALTDYNSNGLIMGHLDIPLNEAGRLQVYKAQTICEALPIKKIYYSPLQRTLQTMQIATQNISFAKIALAAFKERNFGILQGAPGKYFTHQDANKFGESYSELLQRIKKGMHTALADHEPVLIISHGDVYKALCEMLETCPLELYNAAIMHFYPLAYHWHQKPVV